jgi:hypothetical protein
VSIAGTIRPRAVFAQSEACYAAPCRLVCPESSKDGAVPYKKLRDMLYSATPSCVAFYGVIWILAVIVWYSAVLYGSTPYNTMFGFFLPTEGNLSRVNDIL